MFEKLIEEWCEGRLENYRRMPSDIKEHSRIEEQVLAGGYGYRQLLELVQNGADAILEAQPERTNLTEVDGTSPQIHVLLSGDRLYVANTGAPLTQDGIEALLSSHSSPKRGNQIGRFGIGFKSLLRLGGVIDVFSSSMSLRFDPERCRREVRAACGLAPDHEAPGLRLAWVIERRAEAATDPLLEHFHWATTVVRAEVQRASMFPHLRDEIRDFPTQFLLFLPIDVAVFLETEDGHSRRLTRVVSGDTVELSDDAEHSKWLLAEREVRVTDEDAREDATHLHQRDQVPVSWAIPFDKKREEAGRFWAFFPTDTASRIPGIINAPWKLNNDRRAVIGGEWNQVLMREAALLVAETLPQLSVEPDPGRTLDYFPRRLERQDEPAATLVESIWQQVAESAVISDAAGILRFGRELWRPPVEDKELMLKWCALAGADACARWIHPSCIDADRKSRLAELAKRLGQTSAAEQPEQTRRLEAGSATDWFGEVATIDVQEAKRVLDLAAVFADLLAPPDWRKTRPTLAIIPSRTNTLCLPDEIVAAQPAQEVPGRNLVADALVSDEAARAVLIKTLKVDSLLSDDWRPIIERALGGAQKSGADEDWRAFWTTLQCAASEVQKSLVQKHADSILVLRRDGAWRHRDAVLLPGRIIPANDLESENAAVLVDLDFCDLNKSILDWLDVSDIPLLDRQQISDKYISAYSVPTGLREDRYRAVAPWRQFALKTYQHCRNGSRPWPESYVRGFDLPAAFLLLVELKGLARARLTRFLLDVAAEYPECVEFAHYRRREKYPVVDIEHPLRWMLRQEGVLAIGEQAVPLRLILARICSSVLTCVEDWQPILLLLKSMAGFQERFRGRTARSRFPKSL